MNHKLNYKIYCYIIISLFTIRGKVVLSVLFLTVIGNSIGFIITHPRLLATNQ